MPRKSPDPTARIELLKQSLAKVKKSKIKGPVNADEMAKIAGMTWKGLKPMVDADIDFAVLQRGSEGVAYEFDPVAALQHMIRRLEERLADRRSRNARMAELAGFPAELAATGMSIEELRQLDMLQTSMQKRKIEQGAYVPLIDHEHIITDIFTTIQTEALATVSRLDPAGRWPANVRAAVGEEIRSLLARLHNKLGAKLKPHARPATANRGRAKRART